MGRELEVTVVESIESLILTVRGQRVMLDSDLARIYGVTTHRLNEQLKRNEVRFPEDFAFRLTPEEYEALRSQIAISKSRGGRRYLPWEPPADVTPPGQIGFHIREQPVRYHIRRGRKNR